MSNQFKNPLPGKQPPGSQNEEWLNGGQRPAGPGKQRQGNGSPAGQRGPQNGGVPLTPGGTPPFQGRTMSPSGNLVDQQTIKQPSFPGSLPQTPGSGTYVQGQHGRYGAGGPGQGGPFPGGPGPQSMPGRPNGPQGMSGGPGAQSMPGGPQSYFGGGSRRPDGPMGPGMNGGPASFPQGPNSFNQANSGSAFTPPPLGMVQNPPQTPNIFQPGRPQGPGSFGRPGQMGPSARKHDGPPGKDPKGKRKKKRRVPIWARVIIGFLLFFVILGGTGYAYYQVNYAGAVSHIIGQKVQLAKGEENPNANLTGGILSGPRINILLLGSDTDQKFQGNHYIAQTDIVVTIDPSSHTVGMLSIPRDFYIPVPGYGLHKLDEAYGLGGVDLSRRTIEQDFGIPINYYAWIGLDGFIKVINEVGGVDVDVLHPIDDDNYPDDTGANANDPYALMRLNIPPGPQHLDGPTALEYVRSRHADLVGDFGRSARQQEVLSALKPKLANPDIFNHLPNIANDLQGYLKTDMELPDVLKLMNFARSLNVNKINKLILGPPYSHSGTAPQGTPDAGASVVFPDCAQIVPAITQMLQLGNSAACNIGSSGSIAPASTSLPLAYTMNYASAPTANCTNLADMSTMNSDAVSGPSIDASNLLGVQGLLDLMLMGVFESPNVF